MLVYIHSDWSFSQWGLVHGSYGAHQQLQCVSAKLNALMHAMASIQRLINCDPCIYSVFCRWWLVWHCKSWWLCMGAPLYRPYNIGPIYILIYMGRFRPRTYSWNGDNSLFSACTAPTINESVRLTVLFVIPPQRYCMATTIMFTVYPAVCTVHGLQCTCNKKIAKSKTTRYEFSSWSLHFYYNLAESHWTSAYKRIQVWADWIYKAGGK